MGSKKCADMLSEMMENDGLIGVKTSFEDEGALFEETVRLKQICSEAGTKLTLKIGGPEAIKDMKEALIIGVDGIVAPMIESEFALIKFMQAIRKTINKDHLSNVKLNINIETLTAVENIAKILNLPESGLLNGVTVGRVDLVSSMKKDRSYVNSEEVYEIAKKVFSKAKEKGLKACLGGAVTTDSKEYLEKLHSEGLLDKFETRYAIYNPSKALVNLSRALYRGQVFECEWLKLKQEHYKVLANQDSQRIEMIQERINKSSELS